MHLSLWLSLPLWLCERAGENCRWSLVRKNKGKSGLVCSPTPRAQHESWISKVRNKLSSGIIRRKDSHILFYLGRRGSFSDSRTASSCIHSLYTRASTPFLPQHDLLEAAALFDAVWHSRLLCVKWLFGCFSGNFSAGQFLTCLPVIDKNISGLSEKYNDYKTYVLFRTRWISYLYTAKENVFVTTEWDKAPEEIFLTSKKEQGHQDRLTVLCVLNYSAAPGNEWKTLKVSF